MYFEFQKPKQETVKYKDLDIGDMFRYGEIVYIKLNGDSVLDIWTDAVEHLIIDLNEDVELLDYEIIIYAEE